jgi:hypothetical protein
LGGAEGVEEKGGEDVGNEDEEDEEALSWKAEGRPS